MCSSDLNGLLPPTPFDTFYTSRDKHSCMCVMFSIVLGFSPPTPTHTSRECIQKMQQKRLQYDGLSRIAHCQLHITILAPYHTCERTSRRGADRVNKIDGAAYVAALQSHFKRSRNILFFWKIQICSQFNSAFTTLATD